MLSLCSANNVMCDLSTVKPQYEGNNIKDSFCYHTKFSSIFP